MSSLRDTLRFIILACIFATPFICLFVAENMFFPFITGKNFTFRILVEVMLGAWGILMFIDAKYRPRFSWILAAAGAFLAVIAIADFTGVNPYKSFWSNYERMEGLIAHIHLFLYFIIAGTVLTTEDMWKWFWRTTLGASVIVDLYAFSQFSQLQSTGRLDGTFGNAAYLAIYALFNIFIAAFLYVRSANKTGLRYLYPLVALSNLVILFGTQTRGTILGLVGGTFLIFLLLALFDKEHPKLRKYSIAGVIGVIVLVVAFLGLRHSSIVQKVPALSRMASISLHDKTTESRFMIWNMSWQGFKERPILGWGQENFLYVFSKYYNPKMFDQEPWFDRSHDVFFDWLIAGGALGLLTYLSMFGAMLYYLWFAKNRRFSVLEASIFTGMLAGYFIHNVFVFDNLTSYIVFFGLLAYLHALHAEEPSAEEVKAERKQKKGEGLEAGDIWIAVLIITAITGGLVYWLNIRNINANVALINAMQPQGILVDDGHNGKKIAMADLLDPTFFGAGEVTEQLAQFAVQTLDPRVPDSLRKQFYQLTADQFESELKTDPNNLRTQSFVATFYARFGQYDKAIEHFKKSLELSPTRQSVYDDFAMMYVSMGQYASAVPVAKKGYELDTDNGEAGVAYATALIYNKQNDEADKVIAAIGDSKFDQRIINAYGNTGGFDKVVALVNEKIAEGKADAHDYFSLAGGLASIGKKDEAIAAVNKAVSMDSSLKDQGDQLIQQIRSGNPIK